MYGQVEATSRMAYLPPQYASLKPASIGVAIPGGNLSLMGENGEHLTEKNKVGQLMYKGKNVSMGYAYLPSDLLKPDENKGVLFTGDLAYEDEDGFFYIVGRQNRFVKLDGHRVSLDETEQLLRGITEDVACVADGEKMKIFITEESVLNTLRTFVSKKTGINVRAFEIVLIDKIPRTPSGKILYSGLTLC
jgi:acyl-coenzyme A synthetase/AMP-(fatty) acid ligase